MGGGEPVASRAEDRPGRQYLLLLDGMSVRVRIDDDQYQRYYVPLARLILALPRSAARCIVGIAGPPGSGKTVFAALLVSVINTLARPDLAVAVGLDGWHYPNGYLLAHVSMVGGRPVHLMHLKGSAETFDADAALTCLQRIRRGETVVCPVYDRLRHDVVPETLPITEDCSVVVLEGNYLLLDQAPWAAFRPRFDLSIYLDADDEVLVAALRRRHLQGGRPAEAAETRIRQIDLPNAALVRPSRRFADVTLVNSDQRRIAEMAVGTRFRGSLEAGALAPMADEDDAWD
jgi:pantothenate kinase